MIIIKKYDFRSFFSGALPLFILAHFSHHLLTALPVPLLPMIRKDFTLSYTQSGLLISAFALTYGISQLPGGWIADRIGHRILIAISISGVALNGLFIGLSQTYLMMLIFLVIMGIAGGGYHPAVPSLISMSIEPRKLGRALGLHVIGGSTSYFLAPLLAAAIAASWGWRGSFIGLAAPTVIFGIVLYFCIGHQKSREKNKRNLSEKQTPPLSKPGNLRNLMIFIFLSTFTQAVLFSTITFIPLYMVDQFGIHEETAAAFLGITYSAGLWASPLGGYFSDRFGRVRVILAVCFVSGPIIYLLNTVNFGLSLYAILTALGTAIYTRMPASEAYLVTQTSKQYRSKVLGIYFFSGMEGSGILAPVMGILIDRFGFSISFTAAGAALFVVTLICSLWLKNNSD